MFRTNDCLRQDHPLPAVRDCLLNTDAATLHIGLNLAFLETGIPCMGVKGAET
jgi:hypothetical protein